MRRPDSHIRFHFAGTEPLDHSGSSPEQVGKSGEAAPQVASPLKSHPSSTGQPQAELGCQEFLDEERLNFEMREIWRGGNRGEWSADDRGAL